MALCENLRKDKLLKLGLHNLGLNDVGCTCIYLTSGKVYFKRVIVAIYLHSHSVKH